MQSLVGSAAVVRSARLEPQIEKRDRGAGQQAGLKADEHRLGSLWLLQLLLGGAPGARETWKREAEERDHKEI